MGIESVISANHIKICDNFSWQIGAYVNGVWCHYMHGGFGKKHIPTEGVGAPSMAAAKRCAIACWAQLERKGYLCGPTKDSRFLLPSGSELILGEVAI